MVPRGHPCVAGAFRLCSPVSTDKAGINAPMESCFGTLKTELVHQACYPTRDAARHDLFAYIEGYYNRQRLHSALGYITPEQAERQAA
jgi:putative transposase